MKPKAQTKADKLRVLFKQGWNVQDAAEITGAEQSWARRIRRELRSIQAGMTLAQQVSRLAQDVKDLRRLVLKRLDRRPGDVVVEFKPMSKKRRVS